MWIGGVRIIILDEEKRLLMVRQRHEGNDIWMVPGGAIEDGENAVAAGIREVKEETGLDVEIEKIIWHIEEVSPERGQRFVNFFKGRVVGGELELGTDPEFDADNQIMEEVRYISKEEMAALENVYPECLRDELWEAIDGKEGTGFKIRV